MPETRVAADHRIMGGVPCVRGTRIPVATIVGLLAQGRTVEHILTDYPRLVTDDVQASLEFAAIAVSERQVPLRTTASNLRRHRLRRAAPPSGLRPAQPDPVPPGQPHPRAPSGHLLDNLTQIADDLDAGAIVVFTNDSIRVRDFPYAAGQPRPSPVLPETRR